MRCWIPFVGLAVICGRADDTVVVVDPSLSTPLDTSEVEAEQYEFKAETGRLMEIIVNSLYTERDVFLRELVSNAADALEKLRVQGLTDPAIYNTDSGESFKDLNVLIKIDKERGEVSVIDTGIGMTKEELAKNLGTVAKSGTEQFIEAAQRGASASNLIGQFGVGFYSAYLVADEITVVSKSPFDNKQHVWQSVSQGGFRVFEDPRPEKLERGTIVTLKLKKDALHYASRYEARKILKRFSSFIAFPMYLGEVVDDGATIKWARLNSDKPIWLQERSEIGDEAYISFYKNITSDSQPPLGWTHFKAEGDIEFTALMYIPQSARKDIFQGEMSDPQPSDVKLYVQRVLINDQIPEFFPNWLSFVTGLVDSNDLPLKVDRETFSTTRVLRVIRKKTISKVLDTLRLLSRDADLQEFEVDRFLQQHKDLLGDQVFDGPEEMAKVEEARLKYPKYFNYNKLWDNFGQFLMLGCSNDASASDRVKLIGLLRGKSTKRQTVTSLDGYIDRMLPGQKYIYYVTGDDLEVIIRSPYMEFFLKNEIEVIALLGAFEEGCLQKAKDHKGIKFRSVEKDKFDDGEFAFLLAGADEEKQKEITAAQKREHRAMELYYKPLTDWASEVLGLLHAQYVSISTTLTDSPAKVSSPEHGFTASHERMARTSLAANRLMVEAFAKMKTFELNPRHWLIYELLKQVNFQKSSSVQDFPLQREVNHTIDLLYETALIGSGFPSRRPHIVTNDLYLFMAVAKHKEYNADNPFRLEIPQSIYIQVDREARTKAAKESQEKPEETDDEDDFDELFDHDEL